LACIAEYRIYGENPVSWFMNTIGIIFYVFC
jgi:hypothetical protein